MIKTGDKVVIVDDGCLIHFVPGNKGIVTKVDGEGCKARYYVNEIGPFSITEIEPDYYGNLCKDELTINVKYFTDGVGIEKHGDWMDLSAAETVTYKKGDYIEIPLGVAMKLPAGYEANVLPRSSTFKRYGILLVTGMSVIDNAYCGDADEWKFPVLAMADNIITKGTRIAQFRIVRNMPTVITNIVEQLPSFSRGGIGSSGI